MGAHIALSSRGHRKSHFYGPLIAAAMMATLPAVSVAHLDRFAALFEARLYERLAPHLAIKMFKPTAALFAKVTADIVAKQQMGIKASFAEASSGGKAAKGGAKAGGGHGGWSLAAGQMLARVITPKPARSEPSWGSQSNGFGKRDIDLTYG